MPPTLHIVDSLPTGASTGGLAQHMHKMRDEGLASMSRKSVGFFPTEQSISGKNPELPSTTLQNELCFENSISTTVNGFFNIANSHNSKLDLQEDRYVLVTGGAGYIGSHTVLELLKDGHKVIVIDNFSNSCEESLIRIQKLAKKPLKFHHANVLDEQTLTTVFEKYKIWAVLHFAALKAVGESTKIPLDYYWNNVTGSLNLLRVMEKFGVHNIVFSSSATVYGDPEVSPVDEQSSLGPVTNPYGKTKLFIEEVLRDMCKANKKWNSVILRYFNPTGAHPSGVIGENPRGIPNNLMPYVSQVVQGRLPYVNIYGGDYDTIDGTGVRDYIHVCDLATGHVAALRKLRSDPGCVAYNLGTGIGYSVLQIIRAMSRACGKEIPYKITDRRPGDVGTVTADARLANIELGWYPKYNLDHMCQDLYRWTSANPTGYPETTPETKGVLQDMYL